MVSGTTDVVHVVRGKCKVTGKQYKLVRSQIKQAHEVRGEDEFTSVYEAIHTCIQATKAWRFDSPSVVFDVEKIPRPISSPPALGGAT